MRWAYMQRNSFLAVLVDEWVKLSIGMYTLHLKTTNIIKITDLVQLGFEMLMHLGTL